MEIRNFEFFHRLERKHLDWMKIIKIYYDNSEFSRTGSLQVQMIWINTTDLNPWTQTRFMTD